MLLVRQLLRRNPDRGPINVLLYMHVDYYKITVLFTSVVECNSLQLFGVFILFIYLLSDSGTS